MALFDQKDFITEQLQALRRESESGNGAGAPGSSKGHVRIDARSDIFSLGVVLYELLAGRHPFGRIEQRQASRRIAHELLLREEQAPPPLVQTDVAVGNSVSDLVRRCMTVDPSARPATAQQLGAELKKNLAAPRRISRWAKGHSKSVAAMLASLLIVFGGLAYAVATRPPKSLRLSEQGLALMERGAADEAVEAFRSAIDSGKDLAGLRFLLGRARQQAGDYGSAIDDYQDANDLEPDGKYWACIAYCHAKLGKYEEALDDLVDAESHGFQSAEFYATRGRCCLMRSNHTVAMKYFCEAIERNKELDIAYYGRVKAATKWRPGDPPLDRDRALKDIDRATKKYKRFVNVFLDAAVVSYSLEMQADPPRSFDMTIKHLTAAVKAGCAKVQLEPWLGRREIGNDQRLQDLMKAERLGKAQGPSEPEFLLDPLGELSVGELRESLVFRD